MKLSLAILLSAMSLCLVNCSVKASGGAVPNLPKPRPAPQPGPAPAPQAIKNFQSGDYKPTAGYLQACPQNVGTATANDIVIQLYVTLMSPCDGSTILFECENGVVCRGNGAVLTLKSENSYEYNDTVKNWTATFTK